MVTPSSQCHGWKDRLLLKDISSRSMFFRAKDLVQDLQNTNLYHIYKENNQDIDKEDKEAPKLDARVVTYVSSH